MFDWSHEISLLQGTLALHLCHPPLQVLPFHVSYTGRCCEYVQYCYLSKSCTSSSQLNSHWLFHLERSALTRSERLTWTKPFTLSMQSVGLPPVARMFPYDSICFMPGGLALTCLACTHLPAGRSDCCASGTAARHSSASGPWSGPSGSFNKRTSEWFVDVCGL